MFSYDKFDNEGLWRIRHGHRFINIGKNFVWKTRTDAMRALERMVLAGNNKGNGNNNFSLVEFKEDGAV